MLHHGIFCAHPLYKLSSINNFQRRTIFFKRFGCKQISKLASTSFRVLNAAASRCGVAVATVLRASRYVRSDGDGAALSRKSVHSVEFLLSLLFLVFCSFDISIHGVVRCFRSVLIVCFVRCLPLFGRLHLLYFLGHLVVVVFRPVHLVRMYSYWLGQGVAYFMVVAAPLVAPSVKVVRVVSLVVASSSVSIPYLFWFYSARGLVL